MSETDDSLFQPFAAAMAKLKKEQPAPASGKPTHAVPAPQKATRKKNAAQEDDASLFMAAVANVAPQKQGNTFFATPFESLHPGTPAQNKKRKQQTFPQKPASTTPQAACAPAAQEAARQAADTALWETAMGTGTPEKAEAAPPVQTTMSTEEESLFAKAMQGVEPVQAKGRDVAVEGGKGTGNAAGNDAVDMAALLGETFEFALSHNTDEYMEGFVVGTDPMVVGKLKAGSYSPEAHLDLHGQNSRQALDALIWFIKSGYQRNLRCVLVVTGRGKNSPDKVGVLRSQIQTWLTREPFKRVVQAFCTAQASDGGPGAIYVLLRKTKKAHGKIIWERQSFSDEYYDL